MSRKTATRSSMITLTDIGCTKLKNSVGSINR